MKKPCFPPGRRSQMEIMGLAVIVIIVSLAILFVIRSVILKEPSSYKKDFTQVELASNMLSAMLKTTYPRCNGMSLTELFQHCTRNPISTDPICLDPIRTSCEFIYGKPNANPPSKGEVQRIFEITLRSWNLKFEFIAKTQSRFIWRDGSPCKAGFKSKQYPIPVDPSGQNTLFLTLNICD